MTQLIKSLNTLIKSSEIKHGYVACSLPTNHTSNYYSNVLIGWCNDCITCSFNAENKTIIMEALNDRVDKIT